MVTKLVSSRVVLSSIELVSDFVDWLVKYHGVIFDKENKWRLHIEIVVTKAL
jgi:hypothetical protein